MKFQSLLLVVVVTFLTACSSLKGAKSNVYDPAWRPAPPGARIHLFDMASDFSIEHQSAETVQRALKDELTKLGYNVEVHTTTARHQARSAGSVLFGVPGYQFLFDGEFYRSAVGEVPGSDLYVFPAVVGRVAELNGKLAKWDGVEHQLKVVGGSDLGTWSGRQEVYSLRLEVFDPEGTWLMTSFGGISLPIYAHLATRELRKKDDLFADPKDARRLMLGVRKALEPF